MINIKANITNKKTKFCHWGIMFSSATKNFLCVGGGLMVNMWEKTTISPAIEVRKVVDVNKYIHCITIASVVKSSIGIKVIFYLVTLKKVQ